MYCFPAPLLVCISTWAVTLHPFLPLSDRRGERGDGRDHYITKHPAAIVLSNCHTTLPQRSLKASGQVVCATVQTYERAGVGWRERESHEKDDRGNEKKESEGMLREKEPQGRLLVFRVQITTIVMRKYLTFDFHNLYFRDSKSA